MTDALITCKDLTFRYDGRTAVTNLSFQINSGDYLCIVGENGSGKSTLISGLLGLKKPHFGSISFEAGLKQRDIGYLPQQTEIQKDFPASAYEVVLSGRLGTEGMFPFYRKKDKEMALAHMEQLGISHLKNQCYKELSGGQQQRVLLARALCASKRMLILDEPVSGLDPVVAAELYRLMLKINKELNITVVMVTHDIRSAAAYGTKILHMDGQPLFFGTTADYIRSEAYHKITGGGYRNV